jgi:hypothetical protein
MKSSQSQGRVTSPNYDALVSPSEIYTDTSIAIGIHVVAPPPDPQTTSDSDAGTRKAVNRGALPESTRESGRSSALLGFQSVTDIGFVGSHRRRAATGPNQNRESQQGSYSSFKLPCFPAIESQSYRDNAYVGCWSSGIIRKVWGC